jgi:23S rRNA pseudouridine1911/1915/1917 synthase
MSSISILVSADNAGFRLDKLLAEHPDVGSRRRARQCIESGKTDLDGRTCGPKDVGLRVDEGSTILLTWDRPGTSVARTTAQRELSKAGVRILYRDEHLIAVDKPPGLLTDVADREQYELYDSLTKRLRALRRAEGGEIWVVHRIDRDTSGLVLLACSERIHDNLRAQFRVHTPERTYLALIDGTLEPSQGVFEDWMRWNARIRLQVPCLPEASNGVLASARYRTVETFGPGASLVEVQLHTGRRNQIRLHLKLRGHACLGERLYRPERRLPSHLSFQRQALHAWKLVVRHPDTGEDIAFECPLTQDLRALQSDLRGRQEGSAKRGHPKKGHPKKGHPKRGHPKRGRR